MPGFLIDECCTPELVAVALARGHEAAHVKHAGYGGFPDRQLLDIALPGTIIVVTNNRRDYVRLYANVTTHPGLVVIIPSVRWPKQNELFGLVLDVMEAPGFDATDHLIEVSLDGSVTVKPWVRPLGVAS